MEYNRWIVNDVPMLSDSSFVNVKETSINYSPYEMPEITLTGYIENKKDIMKLFDENAIKWVQIPRIKDYKVFNNKVVLVEFEDGTKERSVCDDLDTFDLEVGICICFLKRMLGGSGAMNNMIHKAIKKHDKIISDAKKAEEQKKAERLKKDKEARKKAERRKNKAIEIQKEAIVRAERELNNEQV